ncbi:MAG: hypothetical protein PHP48_02790 [Bacteroidales bacterium]|nr:hypothetical protein [Bacteroidales bacterium]
MQANSTWIKLFSQMLIAVCLFTLSSEIRAQKPNNSTLKGFEITIEMTDKGLKMHSSEGSAWIDLSFGLTADKPQAIDEYGMTSVGQLKADIDPKLADYLFTITINKDGITLTGVEGTAWKVLNFTLSDNGKQTFNQFGMTD